MKEININIEGYNVNGICVGCLNFNRKMFYDDEVKECFKLIGDIDVPDGLTIQVCWECLAAVKNVIYFQNKILQSYNVLIGYSQQNTFLNSPEDFTRHATTRLSTRHFPPSDSTCLNVDIHVKDDVKDEIDLETNDDFIEFELKPLKEEPEYPEDSQFSDGFTSQDLNAGDNISSDEDLQLSKLKKKKDKKDKKNKERRKEKIAPRFIRKKCSWSPQKMEIAVKAVQDGAKLRPTAILYDIPVMTLSDYVKQSRSSRTLRLKKMGRKPVFTAHQEHEIKEHILYLCRQFYGLTPHSLKNTVYEYAEAYKINHPFNKTSKEAGKDWFYGFLKRNPEVTIRRPEAKIGDRHFNSREVNLYFDNLSISMMKYKFPPHRIFNVDEIGINSIHRPGKRLAQERVKQGGAATNWEKGKITICCCVSATGQYIPPMIVYPRQEMQVHLERGGQNECIYNCSKSGCMNEELFHDWVIHFKEHTAANNANPVLLILDNHSSHISLRIYQYCRENDIHMVILPPNTSHRTQPLYFTVFGPLKNALHKECQTYMNTNRNEITPLELIPLLTKAYLKIADVEMAVNGFKTAGIWPLDPIFFEKLSEEGNDEPASEFISAEEAVNAGEPQGLPSNGRDNINPSTSGMNN